MEEIAGEIVSEVKRAMDLHAPQTSAHESYAVILEELEEFWEQVKMKSERCDRVAMRRELIQTAAMCMRAIIDLHL